jgi:hypothetical protein
MYIQLFEDRKHVLEPFERLEIHRLEQRNVDMDNGPQLEWMTRFQRGHEGIQRVFCFMNTFQKHMLEACWRGSHCPTEDDGQELVRPVIVFEVWYGTSGSGHEPFHDANVLLIVRKARSMLVTTQRRGLGQDHWEHWERFPTDGEPDDVQRREWRRRGIVKEERAHLLVERDAEDLQVVWVQQR